ncbi:hypothetical protein H9Y04_43615 [Streptomyces sp. TRM66268-LWL]|uniref:DNA2/NAM7 helicase helicase domain-containing protein n=1 Tax=Streptomyces polyasparticus TaxID=2767826 RepID=A0ABR7SV99_9ACTN|nr:hypothetical protein [Streptomyces polyasparticus]MBC9719420.1 hypothetical protein [Streptomyces polyasparticus]
MRPGGSWPLLPWQNGHPLQNEPIDAGKEVWRHTVFGGVFPISSVRRVLEEHFGPDGEDYGGVRRGGGDTAVFSFTVDAQGVLLDSTTVFSTCAWATGRARDPGPYDAKWLDGFAEVEKECEEAIALLTKHAIPYAAPQQRQETPGPVPAALLPDDGAPDVLRSWQGIVREILGSAAVGALGALIGDLGTGIVAGALRPVATRIAARRRAAAAPTVPDPDDATPPPVPAPMPPTPDADREDPEGPTGRPVELPDLVAFAAHVADLCCVDDLLSPASIRVHSERVRRRRDGSLPDADPAFLNSLLPQDLERVADGGYGAALRSYLTEDTDVLRHARTDVRSVPDLVLQHVSPDAMPLGRWPAPVGQPLALSQQFAVNRILGELADGSGLFSVNGPPGTGKTTMLRDLIAAIVVRRAQALAELAGPRDGFAERISWQSDGASRSVTSPRPSLTGHEIVVASSNNGAVQNITTELPALDALGERWRDEASYFLDQAVSLLDGAPAWGIIAAPLGKAEKRREFMERFWWGEKAAKPDSRRTAAQRGSRSGRSAGGQQKPPLKGMHALLKELEDGKPLHDPVAALRFPWMASAVPVPVPDEAPPESVNWSDAKADFLRAVAHVESLRAARTRVCTLLRDGQDLVAAEDTAADAQAEAHRQERDERERLEGAEQTLLTESAGLDRLRELIQVHQLNRPGGIRTAMGAGRRHYLAWQEQERFLQYDVERAENHLVRARSRYEVVVQLHSRAEYGRQQADRRAEAARRERRAAEQALGAASTLWGDHLPDDWAELSESERELRSPWSDAEFCEARTRVFLAALKLHRAFIVANAGTIRRNLLALKEVFADVVPAKAARAVWQTLFLVVPVVSTTFASCGRLFGPLGKEALGWMLIDEPGKPLLRRPWGHCGGPGAPFSSATRCSSSP